MKEYKFWKRIGKFYITVDKNNLFEVMYQRSGCGAKTLIKLKFKKEVKTWKDEFKSYLGFQRHINLLKDNHMINVRIRKDGEWHKIDADWLKSMVRQEFLNNN